ncbi:hypothetical protein LCGC14_0371370 [marine sediment metagenome]|uniref:Bacteriophage Mu GpT domain-containing protein n=1 Tax=marine sediment metagenome TaxID=412755 RepID=A0A0F9T533_9ZZZZ|nr:hypothetical protein [bacterium]
MSSYYGNLTPNQVKFIQAEIEEQTWNNTLLRNFFNNKVNPGLTRSIPEGLLTYETTLWEKLKPGKIGADIYDLPQNTPGFKVQEAKIMVLGTKIVLGYTDVLRWKNNRQINGGGEMMGRVVNQQMKALYQQVDQFLARGDAFKSPVAGDFMAGAGVFTGLFNGGTTFAGGGGDDVMTAAGDYIATFARAKKALKKAAFEKKKYMIFSDVDVEEAAQQGTNLYTTYTPITEYRAIMERPDVAGWIASHQFIDQAETDYKMVVTTPYTSEGKPAYRLIQGFDFRMIPLYGGALNGALQYEVAVIWSGALEFLFTDAAQVTGTLTLI